MQLLFTQKLETLLMTVCKYGCYDIITYNNEDFKKAIRHIMHMVVFCFCFFFTIDIF